MIQPDTNYNKQGLYYMTNDGLKYFDGEEKPMTNEFKPGFYHLRNSNKAEIFKIEDGFIWGRRMVFGQWQPCYWELDGKDDDQRGDLIAPWPTEPEKVEGWVNIYDDFGIMDKRKWFLDETAKTYDKPRIDCRRITYTKGERKSEEECLDIAVNTYCRSADNAYPTTRKVIIDNYITNYRIGRVWDTTEEV